MEESAIRRPPVAVAYLPLTLPHFVKLSTPRFKKFCVGGGSWPNLIPKRGAKRAGQEKRTHERTTFARSRGETSPHGMARYCCDIYNDNEGRKSVSFRLREHQRRPGDNITHPMTYFLAISVYEGLLPCVRRDRAPCHRARADDVLIRQLRSRSLSARRRQPCNKERLVPLRCQLQGLS